jgi:hypothetical protein
MSLRSTEQSFVVTLKNLNYGKASMPNGVDSGIENGIDSGIDKTPSFVALSQFL